MEIFVDGDRTLVFDIAHNVEKAAHLSASLREQFPGRRISFVVAIGESKDAPHILERFATAGTHAITTQFSAAGRSAVGADELARHARAAGMIADGIEPAVEAFVEARRRARSGDVLVVTGSTFLVAELRDAWLRQGAALGGG